MRDELNWVATHKLLIVQSWFLFSLGFVLLWAIVMNLFGESDEARDARRKRESIARATLLLRATADYQASIEKARLGREVDLQVRRTMERIISGANLKEWDENPFALDDELGYDELLMKRLEKSVGQTRKQDGPHAA